MAQVPDKVLAWLYNVLQDYADTQRAYNDVARVLSSYRTLAPRTEVHTFDNGSTSLLLTLSGTLPTTFRGTTYQFPIKLWLPKSYPREPPFTYVTPGSDMQIRAGQHIAVNGRVYHPYLRDWPSMLDRVSIADLLGYIQQVFAKEPPVMSRSAPRPGAPNAGAATQPPLPPKQHQSTPGMATGTPPPRPPKATAVQDPTEIYASTSTRDVQRDGPPLPPLPGQSHNSAGQSRPYHPQPYGHPSPSPQPYVRQGQLYDQRRVYSPPQDPRLQNALAPTQHVQQQPPRPLSQYSLQIPVSPDQYRGFNGQPAAQRVSYAQPQQQYAPPPQANKPSQDLLSDPFDVAMPTITAPPPPVPVNPEKEHLLQALSSTLSQQAQQKVNHNVSALTPLQGQHNALRAAHARLEAELAQTQALDAAIANNEAILRRSIQECDHAIEAAKTRSLPQVDDVLVAQTLVAQQLWTASAEEAACREAMYVLQTAVDKGRINGSDFVRQMRGLGRECFLKMALARKCARGMGLETGR